MNIGFIGNFEAPYSTENDRKWSFMMLGHNVTKFQENKTTIEQLRKYLGDNYYSDPVGVNSLDMIVYSHTHGWEIEGLISFFGECMKANVPTVSVHLDRWAWLEREKDVGKEATWFTEYHFMADYSPEAVKLYKKHNLKKVFYLQPGAVAKFCYRAAADPIRFPHEIVFTGSKGYHKEYQFRPKLVEWLHKTYGDRFGHYGDDLPAVRGHDLNVLMASAKLVIGDSCFGGRPNYVSDRYYEVRGRGGLLLHPHVTGADTEGVIHYQAKDLNSLQNKIDYYLKNENEREKLRSVGFYQVKLFETYTHRAQEMLDKIFGDKNG